MDENNNWLKWWPIFLAFMMAGPLNIEFVIMNILKYSYGIEGWKLFQIVAILGTLEMQIWLHIFGKMGDIVKSSQRLREFYSDIKAEGFDRYFRKFLKFFLERFDTNNIQNTKLIETLKPGYISMFLMGVSLGGWVVGIPIVRKTHWYGGFIMLILGNIVKLGAFAFGYTSLGNWSLLLLLLVFVYKIRKVIVNSA